MGRASARFAQYVGRVSRIEQLQERRGRIEGSCGDHSPRESAWSRPAIVPPLVHPINIDLKLDRAHRRGPLLAVAVDHDQRRRPFRYRGGDLRRLPAAAVWSEDDRGGWERRRRGGGVS